ncbi:MAG: peptidylprolyl isomerase [Candidatus Omnitrophota bacterium]
MLYLKKGILIGVMALLTFSLSTYGAEQEAADKAAPEKKTDDPVVCKVNAKEIKESQILEQIQAQLRQMGGQVTPDVREKANTLLFNESMNTLISINLLKQKAEEQKLKVEKEDVDKQIEEIKASLPANMKLEDALASSNMTEEDLRKQIQTGDQLLYKKVIDRNIKKPEAPTEKDIKDFYDKNPASFQEKVHASHILLQFPKDGSVTEAQKKELNTKLAAIRADIQSGKIKFEDAAKQYSDCPSKQKGGDLGLFQRGQMVPEFEKAAFDAKVGDLTDIVETKFGYHIIKVTDRQKPNLETEKEKIGKYLETQKYNQATRDYLDLLKKEAKIERVMSEADWEARNAPKEQAPKQGVQIDPEALKKMIDKQ